MRGQDSLNAITAASVIGASLNVIYTIIVSYEPQGFCGPEGVAFLNSPLLSLMPINYIIILTGMGGLVSPYVRGLLKKGFSVTDLKRLFFGMVVSGGSVCSSGNKYCIRFYGKDLVLHQVFADLSYAIYETRSGTVNVRGGYMTQLYNKGVVNELREFSPEFGTRCGGEPSLSFLLEGGPNVKAEASRVLMSTSGWIVCSFVNTTSGVKAYPKLGMGSAIPQNLMSDYVELMSEVDLKFRAYPDRRYEGRGYLAAYDYNTLETFRRLGGFLEGTRVKKGEFSGVERNVLLVSLTRAAGLKFPSKDEAIHRIKELGYDDELKVYLNRLMLG